MCESGHSITSVPDLPNYLAVQLLYLNHPSLLLISYSKLAISQNISIVDYSFKLDHDCMEIFILYMFHNLRKGIRESQYLSKYNIYKDGVLLLIH